MAQAHGVPITFDEVPTQQGVNKVRRFEDVPDLMTMEIPQIDYLVDGLIARGTITLWTGTDGTAKTFLAQKMAVAVATGADFLGRRCQQTRVLYCDYENPSFAVRDRLDLMASGPIADLKVWGTWLEHQPPQIGSELLLAIAKEARPLIILDPFRYAHGAEENDSTAMSAVMQQLTYCKAAGCAVVLLHHPAKTEGSTGRGSSAIRGACDVALLQEMSDETGLITLKCVKNRFGERSICTVRPDYEVGSFEVTDSPEFTKRSAEMEKLQQLISETPGLSQNGIWKKSGMMKSRFVALLKQGNGTLWREEKEGSSLRYFPLVLVTQNNPENNRTGQRVQGCSPVLSLYRENREQPVLDPRGCSRTDQQKPTEKTLPSCSACGSFALYPEKDGSLTCETCNSEKAFVN
jgi:hypothetical protein